MKADEEIHMRKERKKEKKERKKERMKERKCIHIRK